MRVDFTVGLIVGQETGKARPGASMCIYCCRALAMFAIGSNVPLT